MNDDQFIANYDPVFWRAGHANGHLPGLRLAVGGFRALGAGHAGRAQQLAAAAPGGYDKCNLNGYLCGWSNQPCRRRHLWGFTGGALLVVGWAVGQLILAH